MYGFSNGREDIVIFSLCVRIWFSKHLLFLLLETYNAVSFCSHVICHRGYVPIWYFWSSSNLEFDAIIARACYEEEHMMCSLVSVTISFLHISMPQHIYHIFIWRHRCEQPREWPSDNEFMYMLPCKMLWHHPKKWKKCKQACHILNYITMLIIFASKCHSQLHLCRSLWNISISTFQIIAIATILY